MKQETNDKAVPFFARYLETQDYPEVKTDIKAGKPAQTMKAPSDNDEI